MRFVLTLPVVALAAVPAAPAAAQVPAWYCDPLHVYYPAVARCPVPWRAVGPQPQPYAAPSPANQGPTVLVPQATRPSFTVLGDGLDDWCAQARLPSSIATCSDGNLRALVLERQRAYDEARARFNPEQQKALLADQNGWVHSYARTCGLTDLPPSLPLTPVIKDCMAQAGRARIAYLKAYGRTSTPESETGPPLVSESSPPTQPETVSKQFRCRDPNTNFLYERPQPCEAGDVTLSNAAADQIYPPDVLPSLPCAVDPDYAIDILVMDPLQQLKTDAEFGHDANSRINEDSRMIGALEAMLAAPGTGAFGQYLFHTPASDKDLAGEQEILADPVRHAHNLCFTAYQLRELQTEITIARLPADDPERESISASIAADNKREAYNYETPAQRQYEAAIDRISIISAQRSMTGEGNADLTTREVIDAQRQYCASATTQDIKTIFYSMCNYTPH